MAIQTTTNINVDFYDKKYILINAKQLDKNSRFLSVTCYNHGELYQLYAGEHAAYIRYKKPDGHSVYNFCEINNKGKIIVELTEQMLVADGICYADLVIVNKGEANVDADTGEIVAIDNASILSTMTFCVDVSEMAVLNSDIESTYEFNLVNTTLEKYWSDYEDVMQTSKSWAVGNTGIRTNENTDNSKYYSEQSKKQANASESSAISAAGSASSASEYMNKTLEYMGLTETYKNEASDYMNTSEDYSIISKRYAVGGTGTVEGEDTDNAKYYYNEVITLESSASTSATNAAVSESNAATSESNAANSETNAAISETNAKTSEDNASISESNALNSANLSKSYAVGETGVRDGENEDNSKYYYGLVKTVVESINNSFIPMGTISFSELATAEKAAGYVYNINEDFTTDDTFKEGSGKVYSAGTNVYYTGDDYWDCFGGETLVVGVKGDNETTYRKGNINLTAENVGAVATADVATVDEVKNYLGII